MEIRGTKIAQDANGFLSLTDMWRVAGGEPYKTPARWKRLPSTIELNAVLILDNEKFVVIEKTPDKSGIYTRKGRNSQTYAHVILALAYAEYLSPELGIEVREIALRVYAGDVTVLDEYAKAKREQIEEDTNRIMAREEIRRNNSDLNLLLRFMGATGKVHWSKFHDDGYLGQYNLTENQIHALKKLKHGQAILDHMGYHELVDNMFRTSATQRYLIEHNIDNVPRACEVHKRFGKNVRQFLIDNKLSLPEHQPTYPNIRESYKRLKQLDKQRARRK